MLHAVVRLEPGESENAAHAKLSTWASVMTRDRPDSLRASRVLMQSFATALPQNDTGTWEALTPVLLAFALVLLIACANVANIMLARALARQREIGIRLALGADRARLVRQLLTECVLLSLPAAAAGFLISRWTVDVGVRAMFASLPQDVVPYIRVLPLAPDARVFAFVLLAAVSSALLFGLVPALQATRPNIVQASRGDFDTAFRPGRLRGGLVVVQITVCALLLITSGVLLRGAERARGAQTGLRTADVVYVRLDERTRALALHTLATHPVVRDVAGSTSTPLDGIYPSIPLRADDSRQVEQSAYNFVSANYFSVLGIPLVAGRGFTPEDEVNGAPVAIVSDAAARRLWPGRSAIGRYLHIAVDLPLESRIAGVRIARVVGIAGNTVTGWIGTGLERPLVYYPSAVGQPGMGLLALVRGSPVLAREQLDKDLDFALASAPIDQIHTLDELLAMQVYPFKAFSWISAVIGAIALLLTVAGVYGVLSYLVTQRTREIGIRMALGASIAGVVRMVLRQSLAFAVLGSAIGVTLALGASRLLASGIPMVDAFDVTGYASGVLVILAASIAASYAPARRAARVDPLQALKSE
jgi:predicted permease